MDLRERMSFLLVLLLLLAPAHSYAKAAEIVVFAQVGNSVTLLRKPWGKNENIHVNWYFNDQILIYRNPTASTQNQAPPNWQGRISLSTDFSLKISPVTENDFGIFECVQYELTDRTTDKYKLYQVKMSTPPPLLSGATLTLSCEIEREGFNLVHPSIHWLGPDDKIQNGYSNGNKYTLSVIKASGIHNGNWICVVQYGANSILNATTNVVIVDLAPPPLDPIYAADSSSNFAIPCSFSSKISWSSVNATGVKGGSWSFRSTNNSKDISLLKLHPNPSPVWKVPNGTSRWLMESEVKNQDLSVKISKVSVKHRGHFTCSLEFKEKSLSRRVLVEVLQVISSAGKVIYEGSMLNLTCTLGHPMPPDLEVNWKPPSASSLPNLSPPHPTELSIPGIRMKDSGRWTCQLKKNATVLAKATVLLKIEKAPVNIWLVAAIIGGILVLILLAGIAVIIIRRHRKVMKYTRRKRRFCCCKNPQPKGFYKT